MKLDFYGKLYLALGVVLIIIAIFNLTQLSSVGTVFEQKLDEAKIAAVPAQVLLVTITNPACKDCFDIAPIVDSLKKANINVTNEENIAWNSEAAKNFIEKYGIKKIPTIMLFGEVDKVNIKNLERKENALIFTDLTPPYTNAQSGEVLGKVEVTIIEEPSCKKCMGFSVVMDSLKQSGVFVTKSEIITASEEKAKELISKFNLSKLPTAIITDNVEMYPIAEKIKPLANTNYAGYYVLESSAPYVELKTGQVRGLLQLTLINDSLCSECYNVNVHKQAFAQMGLPIESEKTVDINSAEGVQLRMKYNLKKVPTSILTGDFEVYEGFDQFWATLGTIESDNAHVFRNVELLGQKYMDLISGEVINPQAQASPTNSESR